MWWIKFSLLMLAQILITFHMGTFLPYSPALLALLIIWGFAVWFIAVLSNIAWLREIQESGESSPHFTIIFNRKTISLGIIIPGVLFAIAAVSLLVPVLLVIPIGLLTFVMSPIAGIILLDRAIPICRITFISAISFIVFVLIIGWALAYTIDNRAEYFFGKGSVLTEIANERLRFPQDRRIPNPGYEAWQITSVFSMGDQYCARLQFYTWMRIPTHVWQNCFGSVLLKATFVPGENGSIRPQDRLFRARGTSSRTEVQALNWEDGALTLTLNPYFPLTGLVLEFIDDGDIILTLFPSDAATNSEEGTLTWTVPDQPWQDGDSLTFRIRAERLPGDPAGP